VKKLLLIGTAVLLMATSANAAVVYDRYNNVVPVYGSCAQQGNKKYCFRNGVLSSMSVRHGNVSKVYNATGFIGTIRNYSNGASQSWDKHGRVMFHTYGRY